MGKENKRIWRAFKILWITNKAVLSAKRGKEENTLHKYKVTYIENLYIKNDLIRATNQKEAEKEFKEKYGDKARIIWLRRWKDESN